MLNDFDRFCEAIICMEDNHEESISTLNDQHHDVKRHNEYGLTLTCTPTADTSNLAKFWRAREDVNYKENSQKNQKLRKRRRKNHQGIAIL